MTRLLKEHSRLVGGAALLVAAVVIVAVGFSSIRDEIFVAIQLPYLLTTGVGALVCAGLGLVLLRSQDEVATRSRLMALEAAHVEMSDRFDALGVRLEYATQLLEAALRDDDAPAKRSEVRV